MRIQYTYTLEDTDSFKKRLLEFSKRTNHFCILDSCSFQDEKYDFLAAIEAIDYIEMRSDEMQFEDIKNWNRKQKDWKFGYFSYDLKNHFENLSSENPDDINFGYCTFFVPQYVLTLADDQLVIHYRPDQQESEVVRWLQNLMNVTVPAYTSHEFVLESSMPKEEYLKKVDKIIQHIQRGDIYEMNFCQEFSVSNCMIEPGLLFARLIDHSPAPQSAFLKIGQHYLMSASPERYLRKEGLKVISQPMKGTAKRSNDRKKDAELRESLSKSQKERSENVMIVDLVRNDLSRTAEKGSVKVDELFGLYTFPHVHQMISTVSATLDPPYDVLDVVETSFPMGSMTGAPKIRAMQLIDAFETKSRGIFSGSVGYIDPEGNADFNVVIRSIMYNEENRHLSFQVGGAITAKSDPIQEFEECMLKARALINVLSNA